MTDKTAGPGFLPPEVKHDKSPAQIEFLGRIEAAMADVIPGPHADPFTDDEIHEHRRYAVSRLVAPDHWSASEMELVNRNARWLASIDSRDADIYRLAKALVDANARADRYADKMRENGWSVGHDFTPNPDHPDDGACVFVHDDFDGTVCDGLEDNHVA